ncbi:hypothetical protein [Mesorhizobium sp. M0136]|uniref:hypothetical protein n=1 Tax=Mesorhizobium sp. M0136 TaxID=2956890 RepID=UPI003338F3AE
MALHQAMPACTGPAAAKLMITCPSFLGQRPTTDIHGRFCRVRDIGLFGLAAPALPSGRRARRSLARPGLSNDAIQRKDRVRSDKTQRRLRAMIEIINKVEPRFGSALMAYALYRSQPQQGFPVRRRCTRAQRSARRRA